MSQFDFPRIHFSGSAFINPATANNNILLPLVTYHPIQVKAILPPRIYLSQDLLYLYRLGGLPIPEADRILSDEKKQQYIEIKPVDTREKFMTWAVTPLGSSSLDALYHVLYELVLTKRTQKPLTGHLPANWNFFGGMEFGFQGVTVTGVVARNDREKPQLFTLETSASPPEIAVLLGATLHMENEQGKSSAVMVDVLPTLAFYSQVFCDRLQLKKDGVSILNGKPRKASLRFLNQHRIINQEGAQAASGSFFSVIPTHDLESGELAPIMQFFLMHGEKDRPIKGVFIQYNIFEVKENLLPDYTILGEKGNPAYATVAGTFSPWYEEDMASITMGRFLVPENPFLNTIRLAPVVCRVDIEREVISLDFLGSIPEQCTQYAPIPYYETYPLGLLRLVLLQEGTTPLEIGQFQIDDASFSREYLFKTGGIVDLPLKNTHGITQEAFLNSTLGLLGVTKSTGLEVGKEVLLLKESDYMVASDQAGLYADQGDDPVEGYKSNSLFKEPCLIRVFKKGQPAQGPLPMTIMELKITEGGAAATGKEYLKTTAFSDNQMLLFPTDQAANSLYIFYPGNQVPSSNDLISDIVRTSFFISLRILPAHDYGKYLDTNHPEYSPLISFEVLYREVLQVYDLIFPMASVITPFTEAHFSRGWKYLQGRLSPDQWGTATYMPSSRDLSRDQWELFCKWASGLS